MKPVLGTDAATVDRYRSSGYTVLRTAFDTAGLSAEVDEAFAEGLRGDTPSNSGPGNTFRYVPMMNGRTPNSLALLRALAEPAGQLLGRQPLPTRAKGTCYQGSTRWHRDSELPVDSVAFIVYLEPLTAATGALQVIPGSHHQPYPSPPDSHPPNDFAAEVLVTEPGDIIAMDEHLLHSSVGGDRRRQWRVDFIVDPTSADDEAATRAYFQGILPPGWDGGYDVDRYPSYDALWRHPDERWSMRLAQLGVFELAEAQESAARRGRRA
jgi:hypothetical protein